MVQSKAKAKLIIPRWHSRCVGFSYSWSSKLQGEHRKDLHLLFDPRPRGSCSSASIASATQSGFSVIFFRSETELAFINYPVTTSRKQRSGNAAFILQTQVLHWRCQPWPLQSVSLTPKQSLSLMREGQLMSPSTRAPRGGTTSFSLVFHLFKWSKPFY